MQLAMNGFFFTYFAALGTAQLTFWFLLKIFVFPSSSAKKHILNILLTIKRKYNDFMYYNKHILKIRIRMNLSPNEKKITIWKQLSRNTFEFMLLFSKLSLFIEWLSDMYSRGKVWLLTTLQCTGLTHRANSENMLFVAQLLVKCQYPNHMTSWIDLKEDIFCAVRRGQAISSVQYRRSAQKKSKM